MGFLESIFAGFYGGIGIVVLIIVIAIIVAALKANKQNRMFQTGQQIECESKVIAKTLQVKGANSSRTDYYASFELPNGIRQNFPVNVNIYNTLVENEPGTLIYRQNGNTVFFVEFRPKR
jgi:hypothetical protein